VKYLQYLGSQKAKKLDTSGTIAPDERIGVRIDTKLIKRRLVTGHAIHGFLWICCEVLLSVTRVAHEEN
jgi:hypothetical protein